MDISFVKVSCAACVIGGLAGGGMTSEHSLA